MAVLKVALIIIAVHLFGPSNAVPASHQEGDSISAEQGADLIVYVTRENIGNLSERVKEATPGTHFVFTTDLQLPSRLDVVVDGLSFSGNRDRHINITCASGKQGFFVRRTVTFSEFGIRGCSKAAITTQSEERSFNSSSVENGRDDEETFVVRLERMEFYENGGSRLESSRSAVGVDGNVRVVVKECIFIGNLGIKGGAMNVRSRALEVAESVFHENTALYAGGAVFAEALDSEEDGSTFVSIVECDFRSNLAVYGETNTSASISRGFDEQTGLRTPAPSGGAMNLIGWSNVSVRKTSFEVNIAAAAGGAVYMDACHNTNIVKCNFSRNVALPIGPSRTTSEQQGGAMYISAAESGASTEIRESTFLHNVAGYGGSAHMVGHEDAVFRIIDCAFAQNHADLGGGAVAVQKTKVSIIGGTIFTKNSANEGGAIFITDKGKLEIGKSDGKNFPSDFSDNFAKQGGALFAVRAANVIVHGGMFQRNQAEDGGAICMTDSSPDGQLSLLGVQMRNNHALRGGAVFLDNAGNVSLKAEVRSMETPSGASSTIFDTNLAVAGGALFCRVSDSGGNRLSIDQTTFRSNKAFAGLKLASDDLLSLPAVRRVDKPIAEAQISSVEEESTRLFDIKEADTCEPGGGGALCAVLSQVPTDASVSVAVTKSVFVNNSALIGGAMVIATNPEVTWHSECDLNASQISSTTREPCSSLHFSKIQFKHNHAKQAGGAILAREPEHVFHSKITELRRAAKNEVLDLTGDEIGFLNNSVSGKHGYGRDVAGAAVQFVVAPTPDPETGLLFENQKGGLTNPLPRIHVSAVDSLNQRVSAGLPASSVVLSAKLVRSNETEGNVRGQLRARSHRGRAIFKELSLKAAAGLYELRFFHLGTDIKAVDVKVTLRQCFVGERYHRVHMSCDSCSYNQFIFYSNSTCQSCPEHAECYGNASLIPMPGYWHSSPFSVIMHSCINKESCSPEGRKHKLLEKTGEETLRHLRDRFAAGQKPVLTNAEYPQCVTGYTGPLCGSCEEGYGRGFGKSCSRCSGKTQKWIVLALLAGWNLILLSLSVKGAFVKIEDMAVTAEENRVQDATSTHHHSRRSSRRVESDGSGNESDTIRLTNGSASAVGGGGSSRSNAQEDASSDLKNQCNNASEHLSEIIKIGVNFAQIIIVISSIDLDWPWSSNEITMAISAAFGFSSASQSPAMCLVDPSNSDRVVYDVLFRIGLPLILLTLVLCYFLFKWLFFKAFSSEAGNSFRTFLGSRIIVCCLVTSIFVYQSFSESFIGILGCIELDGKEFSETKRHYDHATVNVSYSDFSIAREKYWTEDTTIQCFKGSHAFLTIFLGVPGILLFVVGFPVYLCIFFVRHRNDEEGSQKIFRTHGFICQNYKRGYIFWEVIILARKALVAVIIIFAYPLGSHLQASMALAVLIAALALHLAARPFQHEQLNQLESCWLLLAVAALIIGLVFNEENTSDVAVTVLSVVLFLATVILVSALFYLAAQHLDTIFEGKLILRGVEQVPQRLTSKMKLLASSHVQDAFKSLKNAIHGAYGFLKAGVSKLFCCCITRQQQPGQYNTVSEDTSQKKTVDV